MDARVADGAGHDNTRCDNSQPHKHHYRTVWCRGVHTEEEVGDDCGQSSVSKAELLDDAIRDMLDFTVGWCSDKLSDADKLERIRIIGERAISSEAAAN